LTNSAQQPAAVQQFLKRSGIGSRLASNHGRWTRKEVRSEAGGRRGGAKRRLPRHVAEVYVREDVAVAAAQQHVVLVAVGEPEHEAGGERADLPRRQTGLVRRGSRWDGAGGARTAESWRVRE